MAPTSARKRKASELDDGIPKPAKSPKKKSRTSKKDASTAPKSKWTWFIPNDPEDPILDSAYIGKVKLSEGFETSFGVVPADWGKIKQYRNVKLQDTTFSQGDIIYINKLEPPPEPPSDSATDEEVLKYEEDTFWVGKIIESRATDDRNVWLLVAWLYWTSEIPKDVDKVNDSKPYYGKGELVMSNFFEFIDATTISSKAESCAYFNEWDSEQMAQGAAARFWRQTFDATAHNKNSKSKDVLTPLKTFCRCKKPQKPDLTMFNCANGLCRKWIHEACLVDEVGTQAWKELESGRMDEWVEENKPVVKTEIKQESLTDRMLSPVKAMGNSIFGAAEHILEDGVEAVKEETTVHTTHTPAMNGHGNGNGHAERGRPKSTKTGAKGRPRKSGAPAPWKSKLNVSILADDRGPVATIEEKKDQQRKWQVAVKCLCCGNTLD